MDEHEDDSGIAEAGLGEEGEGVGVGEELVAEGPIHGGGGGQGEGEDVESGEQVDVLELLGLPHCVHNFPAISFSRPHVSFSFSETTNRTAVFRYRYFLSTPLDNYTIQCRQNSTLTGVGLFYPHIPLLRKGLGTGFSYSFFTR